MKNILDFGSFDIDVAYKTFKVTNYNSVDLVQVKKMLDELDKDYFVWLKVNEGDKIEKVLFDYYKTSDYYDLILLVNSREMVFGMPYSYDVVLNAVDVDIQNYEYKVFGNLKESLSEKSKSRLVEKIDSQYTSDNKQFLYLKVIKNEHINYVKRKIIDMINTQKDMYSILEQ